MIDPRTTGIENAVTCFGVLRGQESIITQLGSEEVGLSLRRGGGLNPQRVAIIEWGAVQG